MHFDYNQKKYWEFSIKGFILSVKKAKNEDAIAVVLSETEIRTYYRFFGARHSILQLGYLIDFEVEGEDGRFMPRLRSLSHMGFPWIFDHSRLLLWHNFIRKFEPHLRDAELLDSFYFDLLLDAAKRWAKQNPKRIICESYLALLHYEGRLDPEAHCYICETPLKDEIALMQAFRPAHPSCIYSPSLSTQKILHFFASGSTIALEDYEVEYLYDLVMRGF